MGGGGCPYHGHGHANNVSGVQNGPFLSQGEVRRHRSHHARLCRQCNRRSPSLCRRRRCRRFYPCRTTRLPRHDLGAVPKEVRDNVAGAEFELFPHMLHHGEEAGAASVVLAQASLAEKRRLVAVIIDSTGDVVLSWPLLLIYYRLLVLFWFSSLCLLSMWRLLVLVLPLFLGVGGIAFIAPRRSPTGCRSIVIVIVARHAANPLLEKRLDVMYKVSRVSPGVPRRVFADQAMVSCEVHCRGSLPAADVVCDNVYSVPAYRGHDALRQTNERWRWRLRWW